MKQLALFLGIILLGFTGPSQEDVKAPPASVVSVTKTQGWSCDTPFQAPSRK